MNMKKQKIGVIALLIASCMVFVGCGASEEVNEDALSDEVVVVEEVKDEPVTGLIFEVPQGFVADEEMQGLYLSEEYENDYACIYYQETTADERYSLLTAEAIAELMQAIYSERYGIETVVDVKDFHRFNLDEHEAYYIETEYNVDDLLMHSIEYTVISGEQIYSVTYIQKQNGGWKAAFAQSAKNLQVRQ